MPKSRVRRKVAYTPPTGRSPKKKQSAPWVGGAMAACFVVGIVWLSVFYVTGGRMAGLRTLGNFNLLIGFLFIIAGFTLATRWR